jgi:hypothetical protein
LRGLTHARRRIAPLYQLEPSNNTVLMTVGGSVAERPTVTIIPIRGEEFTSRILTPFDEFQNGVPFSTRHRVGHPHETAGS